MTLLLCKNQGLMLIKIGHVSDHTSSGLINHNQKSQILLHNPIFKSKDKKGFQPLRSYTRLHKFPNDRRKFVVYGVEPGASPSGPPSNILSWVVAAALAVMVPFITKKWGPLIKDKIGSVLQTAEDVAEGVEKVAERVEKVAEDLSENLPKGGKLREAVDFVEKIAERAARDAGAIDDFIDKVQEEEEKRAESLAESRKDDSEKPVEDLKEEKPNEGN